MSVYFNKMRLFHSTDQTDQSKIKAFLDEVLEIGSTGSYLTVPGTIYFNALLTIDVNNTKFEKDVNNILNSLTSSQVIHVTIGEIHSFAIVKKEFNHQTYFYTYDSNNTDEPELLSMDQMANAIIKICKTLPHPYFTNNYNLLKFNIDYNKHVAEDIIAQLRKLTDAGIIELLNKYDKKKIPLIILLSSTSDILKQSGRVNDLLNLIESFLMNKLTNDRLLEGKTREDCNQAALSKIPNSGNITLLHQTVLIGDLKLVQKLITLGVKDTIKTNSGILAIHVAIKENHVEILELLLKNLTTPITTYYEFCNQASIFNQVIGISSIKSLLHLNIDAKHFGITKLLIEKYGANPNQLDDKGRTAFDITRLSETRKMGQYFLLQRHCPLNSIKIPERDENITLDDVCTNRN